MKTLSMVLSVSFLSSSLGFSIPKAELPTSNSHYLPDSFETLAEHADEAEVFERKRSKQDDVPNFDTQSQFQDATSTDTQHDGWLETLKTFAKDTATEATRVVIAGSAAYVLYKYFSPEKRQSCCVDKQNSHDQRKIAGKGKETRGVDVSETTCSGCEKHQDQDPNAAGHLGSLEEEANSDFDDVPSDDDVLSSSEE